MNWARIRDEFPSLENWTYLNTATYGNCPAARWLLSVSISRIAMSWPVRILFTGTTIWTASAPPLRA